MKARIYVDFNEMVAPDVVLLSKDDTRLDSTGTVVELIEGKAISVYSDDLDDIGQPDNLIAEGIVMRNTFGGWAATVKWVLKIDDRGIRHESDDLKG